jgi:hypothetical protein
MTAKGGPLYSIFAALQWAGIKDALFIVNTDDPRTFHQAFGTVSFPVRYYSVPDNIAPGIESYNVFGCAHRQAINLAATGDRIALLCADMTVSQDAFAAAEARFAQGKKLIMAAASSTVGAAPIAPARQLLEWSLDHLTPMCQELFWHEGRGSFPWCVYFRHSRGVDFRGFHLHPFAVVKHPGLTFRGTTSDLYLSEEFPREQVHVVISPDELALVERSPADRARPRGFKVGAFSLTAWALAMGPNFSPQHLWHFTHQITLRGEPDPKNARMVKSLIARIDRRMKKAAEKRERREAKTAQTIAA